MSEFFEAPPLPREPEESAEVAEPPWWGPPKGVLPSAIPLAEVVVRTHRVAVGIAGILAYDAGFELQVIALMTREAGRLIRPFVFDESLDEEGPLSPKRLRVGLEYSDGRKAMNTYPRWRATDRDGDDDADERTPTMTEKGGHGDEREWRQDFWCRPLPSPGRLQVVCEWPIMEIPLTRFEIDAGAVLDAAARSKRIFPDD